MKKLISILISLAMVFTLFAAVPAFAAPEETGSFNIQAADYDNDGDVDQPRAIAQAQDVFLNFEEALDRDNLNVTLYAKYATLTNKATPTANDDAKYAVDLGVSSVDFDIDGDGTNDVNDKSTHKIQYYLKYVLSDDGKSMEIILCDSGEVEKVWATASYGCLWNLYVKVNDSEYRLKFVTVPTKDQFKLNAYGTSSTSTTIKDGLTDVALNKSFIAYSAVNVFSARGLKGRWVVTKGEETVLDFIQDSTSNKIFTLTPPDGAWEAGATYTVRFYISTVWDFDQYGNRSVANIKSFGPWTFTTVAPVEPEPEEPEEPEVPAGPVTGAFNVQAMDIDADGDIDQPYSLPVSQKIYLNFDEAVSTKSLDVTLYGKYATLTNSATPTPNDDAKYAVDLGVNSVNFDIDGDGIVDVNDSDHKIQVYLNYELSADGKSMRIWQCDSGKSEKSWANSSYGNLWNLYVNVNGYEFRLKFVTTPTASNFAAADFGNGATNTTIQNGMTDVALDKSFRVYCKSNVFAARGQYVRWEVTENGVATTAFNTSSSGSKTFNIEPPATGWKADTTYNVKCYVYSAWKFDQAGNRTDYDVKQLGEWNFTTGFAEEPVVTFENGVATITNNTATAVENAFLILVAKTSTGAQRILFVTSEYSLASKAFETKNFALESGEAFDYFLLDSKFAPIIKTK